MSEDEIKETLRHLFYDVLNLELNLYKLFRLEIKRQEQWWLDIEIKPPLLLEYKNEK